VLYGNVSGDYDNVAAAVIDSSGIILLG